MVGGGLYGENYNLMMKIENKFQAIMIKCENIRTATTYINK